MNFNFKSLIILKLLMNYHIFSNIDIDTISIINKKNIKEILHYIENHTSIEFGKIKYHNQFEPSENSWLWANTKDIHKLVLNNKDKVLFKKNIINWMKKDSLLIIYGKNYKKKLKNLIINSFLRNKIIKQINNNNNISKSFFLLNNTKICGKNTYYYSYENKITIIYIPINIFDKMCSNTKKYMTNLIMAAITTDYKREQKDTISTKLKIK
jgi:hypothetical protein